MPEILAAKPLIERTNLLLERFVGRLLVERGQQSRIALRIQRIFRRPPHVVVEQQGANDDGDDRRDGRDSRGKLKSGVVVVCVHRDRFNRLAGELVRRVSCVFAGTIPEAATA